MKNTILYMLLVFSSVLTAYGQKDDTQTSSVKNKLFSADSTLFAAYDFAKSSPFYIKKLMPATYNNLSIGHNFEKGHLMRAQNATKINNTFLSTEGISQLKSISIWGQFSYSRTVEDSVAFAHQTLNNLANPYYYGSVKNVSYQRTIYNLKTLASKNILSDNLPIGLGANYRIGDHYSTNDPRGEINDYQLNLVSTLGYNITKKLTIGTAYRIGYGTEKTNVAYKNNSLNQGRVSPEFTNYLINGYGEPEESNTNRTIQSNQTRSGIDAYLTYDSENIGDFNFSYQTSKEKQKFDYRSNSGITKFIDFNLVSENYHLFWLKHLALNSLSADFNYQTNKGDNYLNNYLANSYLFSNNIISIKGRYTLKKNQYTHNFGLGLSKYEERKQDGVAGNDIRFNQLNYSLSYGINHQNKNNHNWGISVTGLYNQYLDSDFNVLLANEGVFTRNVIYYDYAYNTSSKFGANLTGDYSIPMFKQIQAGIKVGLNYWRRDDLKDFGRVLTSAPGKDRFSSNISLNLYF
ncbi:hypothetical protein G7074_03840 [Pedobacter sp. HDW13]|uniref:DUF6850 family outer membrane beta-barrel protein n=1 Tax=unclassified Pedobacter TaxID=2628915 RepID=UPI000F59CACA|nr:MULTISPECIES: DUF6850 family outer membrane beta-barrel protein [unclassified Pedobacter]QIL38482.1 hypothetical protein G7074_03840 [Pedobacter sp. HDW13]